MIEFSKKNQKLSYTFMKHFFNALDFVSTVSHSSALAYIHSHEGRQLRNVSFAMANYIGVQYLLVLQHRLSTTVSLETNP